MICNKIEFSSPWILKMYALRQDELRMPLGLNLFDENLLSEEQEYHFAGLYQDQIICCLQLKKIGKAALKLRQMATSKLYQGQGNGKELVRFAERWAINNEYKKIELHARKQAQGFYEKLGYEKVGDEFLEVDIPHFKMQKIL